MKTYQKLLCTAWSLFLCIAIISIALFGLSAFNVLEANKQELLSRIRNYETSLKKRNFTDRQIQDMSPLGKWLLAPEGSRPPTNPQRNKTFLILFWGWIPSVTSQNITWENCSVHNCILSDNSMSDIDGADAVVVQLYMPWLFPSRTRPHQRWIFMSERNPRDNVLNPKIAQFNGLYNWSMTYRMNSDIPIPYARTIQRSQPLSKETRERWRVNLKTSKTKLIAIYDNDNYCVYCDHREKPLYILKLKQLLQDDMDIGGECWPAFNDTLCSGSGWDCPELGSYKFYLAFEQCSCQEYMSDQVFWNAYGKNAVPIIMGPSREESHRLLPPNSFIHVDDFRNISALAAFLKELDHDDEKYMRYHEWRDYYIVKNENSLSYRYCRICEALNYNPATPKIYTDIEKFWHRTHCRK